MSDLRINNITDRLGESGPVIAGVSTVTSGQFVVPVGPTEFRGGRGRGVQCGGTNSGTLQGLTGCEYVDIATTGNASDFGDLARELMLPAASASSVRGVLAGGSYGLEPNSTDTSEIEYITISSQGGASFFGDLQEGNKRIGAGGGDNIRMVIAGGYQESPEFYSKKMEYITIATTGDASEFGDLHRSLGTRSWAGSSNSSTRCFFYGGTNPVTNVIDYITTQTKGNSEHFGDLTIKRRIGSIGTTSSTTRGLCGGAFDSPANINTIDYITMASIGNATDFGDMTTSVRGMDACSSTTRALWFGGQTGPAGINTIQYVTIATTGNTSDFGDLSVAKTRGGGFSDCHGGLG